MRYLSPVLFVLLGLALAAPLLSFAGEAASPSQKALDLGAEGQAAYEQKDYSKSLERYAAAFSEGLDHPNAYYDAACSAALAGQKETAFRYLEQAVAKGFWDDRHIAGDTDLETLHADPRWAKVVEGVETNLGKKVADPALRAELLELRDADQAVRAKLSGQIAKPDPAVVQEVEEADARSRARMKEIVAKHGWPGKSLVGEDGAFAAWLLVQHADREPEFQERCLPLLAEAVKKGEARGRDLAYLTDRVLVAQKKPQRYGTQARQEGGKFVPQPLENEAEVDKLRAEVGLMPLADYLKQMEEVYAPNPAAPPAADKPSPAS